jgi:hypothetical protein
MPGPAYATPNPVDLLTRIGLLEQNSLANNPDIDQSVLGRLLGAGLATPAAPTVASTPTTGATTQTYLIVARLGNGVTPGSATGSTTVGPSTLSLTAFNTINWNAVPGATSYDVFRTVGGATQGKIANVPAPQTSLVDTGLVADGTTASTLNSTGVIGGGAPAIQNAATGVISTFGLTVITYTTALSALTLGLPTAGPVSAGGHDGLKVTVLSTQAKASTVTTPSNGINGADHIATMTAAAGNFVTFVAYNGGWWMLESLNITLS